MPMAVANICAEQWEPMPGAVRKSGRPVRKLLGRSKQTGENVTSENKSLGP